MANMGETGGDYSAPWIETTQTQTPNKQKADQHAIGEFLGDRNTFCGPRVSKHH